MARNNVRILIRPRENVMQSMEYANFIQDKSRYRSTSIVTVFLWAYRISCDKRFSFAKFPAKIVIKFFRIIGVSIDSKSIGGGLRMPHLNGIFIHPNASLGENCTILQQVTIGANEHRLDYSKAPQIGNRVYIGAGAKIIGNIIIGDDVRIGANAVVTKSVPAGKTVVGYNRIIESKIEREGVI